MLPGDAVGIPRAHPAIEPAGTSLVIPGEISTAVAQAHVLLIDDSSSDREILTRELTRAGSAIRVTAVGDPHELQKLVDTNDYDIAITDYDLRWITGIDVLRLIKARDPSKPVIMFTGSGSEEVAVDAMKEGLDDYITKSASHVRRVPLAVAALLERRRQQREIARQAELLRETTRDAEERLRVSEERFRAVQEASPDGFSVIEAVRDADGRVVNFVVTYANDAAARQANTTRDELVGKRMLDVVPGFRETGLFDRYVQVVNTGEPWVEEIEYDRDGITAFVRIAAAKVGDGVATSAVDLSERRRAENALREADRQKDDFLAMLAHELRNPLAPIRTSGELLARMVGNEAKVRPVIDIIRRQVAHLSRLVDDLLDVSRITRRRIELEQKPVSLPAVVAQAVETVDPLMRARRHNLRVSCDAAHLYVCGDFARLVQCLVNLLSNAAKFTDPGGEIRVDTRRDDGHALIEVRDNGIGISRSQQARIFKLFVQSEQSLDRAQGGLGIGLSVVQQLIEMHHGEVRVHSEGPGTGSTFCIQLPLIEPPLGTADVAAGPKLAASRFLVVDDNSDAADTMAYVLQAEGHAVESVHHAREVLARIRAFKPGYVLLDIGMPGMDGYELARLIRTTPDIEQPKLIALTGYGQPEDRARALEAGFDEHFVKPADVEQLLRHLARH